MENFTIQFSIRLMKEAIQPWAKHIYKFTKEARKREVVKPVLLMHILNLHLFSLVNYLMCMVTKGCVQKK